MRVGDAARGRTLFKGKAECAQCHRVNGQGPRVAPDLSDIGAIRTLAALQRALLTPDESLLPIQPARALVTKDGRTIRGRRLNEDTYTVQIIDEQENLLSLDKAICAISRSILRQHAVVRGPTDRRRARRRHRLPRIAEGALSMIRRHRVRRPARRAALASPSRYAGAQVTPERLVRAADEPQNWLTYSGGYASQRYTRCARSRPPTCANLEQKWVFQGQVLGAWQSSPLVVDGIMYLTQRPNDVLALDAKTGRVFWLYRYNSADQRVCCGANNRGSRSSATRCSWARSTRT